MYKRDVRKITEYCIDRGPSGLLDVGTFVLTTIRVPLSRTAVLVEDIKRNKENSKALWGFKKQGYIYLRDNIDTLYDKLILSVDSRTAPERVSEALSLVSATPGLGMVKGGFLMQCVGWEIGCLDQHNIKRYKVTANFTKGNTPKKVKEYVDFTQKLGAEHLWDDWCVFVSDRKGHNRALSTPDAVSAFHVTAVTGEV